MVLEARVPTNVKVFVTVREKQQTLLRSPTVGIPPPPPQKLWCTTHFSEIIELKFGQKMPCIVRMAGNSFVPCIAMYHYVKAF